MGEIGARIYWTHTDFEDGPEPDDCCAEDPDQLDYDGKPLVVGRVFRQNHDPESDRWCWSMTVSLPGTIRDAAMAGYEAKRGDAGRAVIAAYRRLMAQLGQGRTRKAPP